VVLAVALAFGNLLWIPIILIAGTLITLLVCWIKANSQAEDDFFRAYAEERGMSRTELGQLPGSTPLLRKGDEKKAEEILEGRSATAPPARSLSTPTRRSTTTRTGATRPITTSRSR
jgi:hypothetical protein